MARELMTTKNNMTMDEEGAILLTDSTNEYMSFYVSGLTGDLQVFAETSDGKDTVLMLLDHEETLAVYRLLKKWHGN